MKNLLLVLLFFISINAFCQKGDTLNGISKKTEQKIFYIESKIQSGEYSEAASSAKVLSEFLEKKNKVWISTKVRVLIANAYANYSLFKFDEANKLFQKAVEISKQDNESQSKILSSFYLVDYLIKTDDIVTAFQFLKEIENTTKKNGSIGALNEFDFYLATILFKQEYINEALQLVDKQMTYRLDKASNEIVEKENRFFVNKKLDFAFRKERYAALSKLKLACLYSKGFQKEANDLFQNTDNWIKSNLSASHPLRPSLYEIKGNYYLDLRKFDDASVVYMDAYTMTTFPEYENQKITLLGDVIVSSIYADQKVKSANYLRRIEMYAFRSIGSKDYFQWSHEYCEAYKSYIEGDYTSSSERLEKLLVAYKFLPESHPCVSKLLILKSNIAYKTGDIRTFKEISTKIAAIQEKYYGAESPVSIKAQLEIALYEIHYGKDFPLAEKIISRYFNSSLKKELKNETQDNIHYMNAIAELYSKTDRYDSAIAYSKNTTELVRNLYSEKSAEYILALAQQSEFQIIGGKYKEGFDNLNKLSELVKLVKEGEPEKLQQAYILMSKLFSLKGEYDISQALLIKASKLGQNGYEKQELVEAEADENLASLYILTGNYFKADKLLTKSIQVKEEKLDKNNQQIIHGYLELAKLNLINGNYSLCEHYLKKSSELTEFIFGNNSLRYHECLLVYADYYSSIGDYNKAHSSVLSADDIVVKKLGKSNLVRSEILLKLALIRNRMNKYKATEIEKLYTEASSLIKASIGVENPLYNALIQKQAEFYISVQKIEQASQLLNDAEKYWSSKLGKENKYIAEIELLRGNIAYSKGKYDQAEKNYFKAKGLYKGIFDDFHPYYIQSSGKLARVYYMQKHTDKSLQEMEEIIPKYLDYVVKYFPSLSFREKSKFWNNIKDEFEFYNYIALCVYNKKDPKLSAKVYNNIISTKALLLNSNIKLKQRILNSQDSVLVELYNEWISEKEYLTSILSFTQKQLQEQSIDLKLIESNIENLEKEISKRSEDFSHEENKNYASWKEIRSSLNENEYAVEIIRCRYFDKVFTDSIIYAALIINKNSSEHPEVAIMPAGKLMETKSFKYYRNVAIVKGKDEKSYGMYWQSIKEKIPDGATVYLSSDGIYNQINIEMLLNKEGQYMIDKNQLVTVTNTKDLLNSTAVVAQVKDKKKKAKSVKVGQEENYVLCGNPEFYSGTVKVDDKNVPELPGAEKEILEINELLKNKGKVTLKFINEDVTEDSLRCLKNPKVFHIATHGFFTESESGDKDELISNPLLNSGLVLAGGGDIISNSENNYVNSKSGILTAYEAMNLSFDNTELVVLSACETGRGEVQAGEGVYGLQRSFLIAGSDAVIMSLFKVNDEVTQKLMLLFYQKWLQTGDKRKAFLDAKLEIKKEYQHPIFWGVFIMVEGTPQRNLNLN